MFRTALDICGFGITLSAGRSLSTSCNYAIRRPRHQASLQALNLHTALGQPHLPPLEVRHRPLDPPPELRRVMRLVQVGHLVHHHVLGDARRQQDGLPVEVQTSRPCRMSPSGSRGPARARRPASLPSGPRSPAPCPTATAGPVRSTSGSGARARHGASALGMTKRPPTSFTAASDSGTRRSR